ncbi:MAG: hypothetical protein K2K60_02420 [Clostridia bacterium]|nr:hypothetical protein [Clostridia bacterium]
MDFKKELQTISLQLKNCFYSEDNFIGLRTVIFIVTGLSALWFYIADTVFLFFIRLFQTTGDELDKFVRDENKPTLLRCVMLVTVLPITYLRYIVVPFLYLPYWLTKFLFNCFAYITSLGKSGWGEIQYN